MLRLVGRDFCDSKDSVPSSNAAPSAQLNLSSGLATPSVIQGADPMRMLPTRMKDDAIVEALLEVRFEHNGLGELLVGRLANSETFAGYEAQRMPLADVPAPVRESDPNMRYTPTLQLTSGNSGEVVRLGSNVVSLHLLAPYPGWDAFQARIRALASALYSASDPIVVQRVGLRYINGFTPKHLIRSIWDLNFDLRVDGERPSDDIGMQYRLYPEGNVVAQVTLASPTYIQGSPAPDSVCAVDIDVYSNQPLGRLPIDALISWIEAAHTYEKTAFFSLFTSKMVHELVEE